jgi:hypothetical protein
MKRWIRQHALTSYFLVAYAVSWSIAVPLSSHDMCFSQHAIVDARVLEFLRDTPRNISERIVA